MAGFLPHHIQGVNGALLAGVARKRAKGTKPASFQPGPSRASQDTRASVVGDKPPSTAAPFLNPDQQGALNTIDATTAGSIGQQELNAWNSGIAYNAALAANKKAHDVNTDMANQDMAARGMFQSSIRAGDLNDIDATLATRNNTAWTTFAGAQMGATNNINTLTNTAAITHNMYNGLAVQNAQGITPTPEAPPPGAQPNRAGQHQGGKRSNPGQLTPFGQPRQQPLVDSALGGPTPGNGPSVRSML